MATRAAHAKGELEVWDEFGSGQHQETPLEEPGELQGCIAAQQWLASLAQWCKSADGARVKQQLGELLRCGSRHRDKLAVVANRARQQIANIFSWAHQKEAPPADGTPARARQCQYLFERALHGMLQTALAAGEAARGKPGTAIVDEDNGGKPGAAGSSSRLSGGGGGLSAAERGSVVEAVLEDEEYQLGLVHACIEVVNFAYLRSPAEAFPWAALQLRRMHHSVELWQGIDWLVDGLADAPVGAEGIVPGIPEEVVAYLSAIQVRVEEELAFIDGSSIYKRIVATGVTECGGAGGSAGSDEEGTASGGMERRQRRQRARRGSHSPRGSGPDAALVARFLTNLARTAMLRTTFVAQQLLVEHPSLQAVCPELALRACSVVDALLADHLDLLFGQHLSVAIACALFFTIKHHGGSLSFRKLTILMVALLPNHDEATFSHAELPAEGEASWDGSSRNYGDTRAFYNTVFLPVFLDKEPADLFGDECMTATPSKAELEEPAAEAAAPDGNSLVPAASSGHPLADGSSMTEATGAAAVRGAKEQRRLRRPLGQVVNGITSGGAGSRGAASSRAGNAARGR
ncbi:hypothetical protein ABPG77_009255 [Micractinium sp. CCAP 211/92]